MEENISWYIQSRVDRTIKAFDKNNMKGIYVKDEVELIDLLEKLISKGSKIGVGDSHTLIETGILDYLRKGDYNFLDKYEENISKDKKNNIYLENFSADTFICSTNAMTEDGKLFNIDGNGSRVAPIIYGPKQVLIIAGINKIVKDIEEAENRVRNYCAPIDAKRLNKNTPCTKLGYCIDCNHEERICNDFVTINGQFIKDRIKIIIIGKSLGY